MSSQSEKGHAKNVANFETQISFCTAYGTAYNPSKQSLKIDALNALLTQSRTSLSAVINAKNRFDLVANERQIQFNLLKSKSTRIINALAASDATQQTIDDAKSINRKIQGHRSSPKPAKSEEKHTISTSQQSYDSLIENFSKLIDLLTSEPSYAPNEEELKVETLNTYAQQLRIANTNVINAHTVYSNSMISRNKIMYANVTGLIDMALSVKKYVKAVFGATSPQYKQVSGLEFTRPQ